MKETPTSTLRLDNILVNGGTLRILWSVDESAFTTTLTYDDVDLDVLRARLDPTTWDRMLLHIALFEMSKGVNLRAEKLDLGAWREHFSPELAATWHRIIEGVFAQWRWQHDDPTAPIPMAPTYQSFHAPEDRVIGDVRLLSFCGGGKDSLVSADLIERTGQAYGAFVYTHSIYGDHDHQRRLVDGLLEHLSPAAIHHLRVDDTFFTDAPVAPHDEIIAAETPSSIMAAMPIVLTYGYEHIVLGHERSANKGNLIWDRTGEDVNHQWGKSREAEDLLNLHLSRALLRPFSYFSILQPIHDPVIFSALRHRPSAVAATHSCNRAKPWCMKCPKCVYVWLGYAAWLPEPILSASMGGANPLTDPDVRDTLLAMLGLADHLPFECIGQIEESRLLLHMIRAQRPGLPGVDLADRCPLPQSAEVAELLEAHAEEFGAPDWIARDVLGLLRDDALEARMFIDALLGVRVRVAGSNGDRRASSADRDS